MLFFGASQLCVATHPSDMCVALAAIGATIIVQGPNGVRSIPSADFHRLPGNGPEKDTTLVDNEVILGICYPGARASSIQLFEDPRSPVLRLCHRLGRGIANDQRRSRDFAAQIAWAASHTNRGGTRRWKHY